MLVDPFTGEQFIPKRSNQKFAKPENRVRFHNVQANAIRHTKAVFDKPLHRNYIILSQLLSDTKEAVVHKEFLRGKGFNIGICTHVRNFDGKSHFAVYDYVVITKDENLIKIIKP